MSHAIDESPDYVLLAHYTDDTLAVICHYHGLPEEAEINADCARFYNIHDYDATKIIRFRLAEVKVETTPAMLDLVETAQ